MSHHSRATSLGGCTRHAIRFEPRLHEVRHTVLCARYAVELKTCLVSDIASDVKGFRCSIKEFCAASCDIVQVRRQLGLAADEKMLLLMYGGQPAGSWHLRASALPPGWR